MSSLHDRCAVAIMAKAPRPGRSKTRLCPPLTATQAAQLSAAFIRDMTASVAAAGRVAAIDSHVAYAPAGTEAELAVHVHPGTALLLADGGDIASPGVAGFGRPLLQTVGDLLGQGYGGACVVNSDSPTLPAALLADAAGRVLDAGPGCVVFGASTDGGYYFLGMRTVYPTLFADIDWSTEHVAAQTRTRAREAGLMVAELPQWYDVDDIAGLQRLLQDLDDPRLAAAAPATAAALAGMGLMDVGLGSRLGELA